MSPINSVGENRPPVMFNKAEAEKKQESGFGEFLTDAVKNVNDQQKVADKAVTQVVKGEIGIHEGMLTLAEADISLRAMLKVRSKALEAYKEIMRMPV